MAQRGKKAKPRHLKAVANTERPDRGQIRTVPELEGEVSLPPAFSDLMEEHPKVAEKVLETWNRKVKTYELRRQSVVGCEDTLYQYCMLEVTINELYRKGAAVNAPMISQHRVYANEFYDTPASQLKSLPPGNKNPFNNNGKRPT